MRLTLTSSMQQKTTSLALDKMLTLWYTNIIFGETMENLPVGTKVKAKRAFPPLRVEAGSIGYVYENYKFGSGKNEHIGASIIFEKGGYDGFSLDEQAEFLEDLGIDTRYEHYHFTGVINLYADFMDGFWKFEGE